MKVQYTTAAGRKDVALARYAKDMENITLDEQSVETIKQVKKSTLTPTLGIPLIDSGIVRSTDYTEYVKDTKFKMNLLASEIANLENLVGKSIVDLQSTLSSLDQSTKALASSTQELEVVAEDKVGFAFFNSFCRNIDYQDDGQFSDPKSGVVFSLIDKCNIEYNSGLTLPIKAKEAIVPEKVELLYETTSFGNTRIPLYTSDVKNLLQRNLVFRNVFLTQSNDETGRLYKVIPQNMSLGFAFKFPVELNFIEIISASRGNLALKSASYLNDHGEEISLDVSNIVFDSELKLHVVPIKALKVYLNFEQVMPIDSGEFDTNFLGAKMEEVLSMANWTASLSESSNTIVGNVYDMSLASVKFELREYSYTGYFYGKPLEVVGAKSFSLDLNHQDTDLVSTTRDYGVDRVLDSNTDFFETWLNIKIDEVYETTIPIPYKNIETEKLLLNGNEAGTTYKPDLFYDDEFYRISSAVYNSSQVTIALNKPHGLSIGETYGELTELFISLASGDLNVKSDSFIVLDSTTIQLERSDGISVVDSFDSSVVVRPFWIMPGNNPIEIYQDGSLLTIGDDYSISVDNGNTWNTTWISYFDYKSSLLSGYSSGFKVRFTNPDHSSTYWIKYKKQGKQYVTKDKELVIKNNVAILDKSLFDKKVTIRPIIVMRNQIANKYATSVITNFTLKVQT